eukprot:6457518-Amphidinium_carterae.1
MRSFKGQIQKAAGMNLAKDIVQGVSDLGEVKTRPELKMDLCHLVAQTCVQINTEERKTKAWRHLIVEDAEWEELLDLADTFHAR